MSDPIVYVEDEPDDVFFMQRAFKKVAPDVDLKVITDGQAAADYFSASEGPPLSLVILDLNLPGRSGFDVLAQIRKSPAFHTVPVIIFSASNQERDIESGYLQGCNAYLVKPGDPEKLRGLATLIHDFWVKENRYLKGSGGITIVST